MNIDELIIKAKNITPEDEFKLRLKRTIKEQQEKKLTEKILQKVEESLIPLKEDNTNLKGIVKKKLLAESNNAAFLNGKLNKIDEKLLDIEDKTNKKLSSVLDKIDTQEKPIDNSELIRQQGERMASSLAEIKFPDNSNIELESKKTNQRLETVEKLITKTNLLLKENNLSGQIISLKDYLGELNPKDFPKLDLIEDSLGQLLKKKNPDIKDIESSIKNLDDIMSRAWSNSSQALKVEVQNPISSGGGGGIIPFERDGKSVKAKVNTSGLLRVAVESTVAAGSIEWDYMGVSLAPTANIYEKKNDGIIVETKTINFTDSTKRVISNITKV